MFFLHDFHSPTNKKTKDTLRVKGVIKRTLVKSSYAKLIIQLLMKCIHKKITNQ
uniref:Uncharacterized protein n=1 Tax=Kalanchoe fedtschenkoi TaxID=63787 RepID=A0A7N0T2T6_KALFE